MGRTARAIARTCAALTIISLAYVVSVAPSASAEELETASSGWFCNLTGVNGPTWLDTVAVFSVLWTVPVLVWLGRRFGQTWLRPIPVRPEQASAARLGGART